MYRDLKNSIVDFFRGAAPNATILVSFNPSADLTRLNRRKFAIGKVKGSEGLLTIVEVGLYPLD
jgi:hypothetical protein